MPLRHALQLTGLAAVTTVVAGLGVAAPASATADPDCPGMATPAAVTTGTAPTVVDDTATTLAGGVLDLHPLANDTDPDANPLTIVNVGESGHGDTCLQADGTLQYLTLPSAKGFTETLPYAVTDGDFYRSGRITVTVNPDVAVVPTVVRKLRHSKPARLKFTNSNTRPVRLMIGSPKAKRPFVRRTIAPGATTIVRTSLDHAFYVASLRVDGLGGVPMTVGTVNTRTGKVRSQDVADLISMSSLRTAGAVGAARAATPWS